MPQPAILIQPANGAPRAPITPQEWEGARRGLPGPDPYFCAFCRVGTWTPYTCRQPGPQQWLRPSWTACDDPDCRARVDAAVVTQSHQGRR
jgi:hypothetical protein